MIRGKLHEGSFAIFHPRETFVKIQPMNQRNFPECKTVLFAKYFYRVNFHVRIRYKRGRVTIIIILGRQYTDYALNGQP